MDSIRSVEGILGLGLPPELEEELLKELAEELNYRLAVLLDLLVKYPWLCDMITQRKKEGTPENGQDRSDPE